MTENNTAGWGRKSQLTLGDKYMLTIKEAADYFNIGTKSLRRLAESHTDQFAIIVGNRYLIVRHKFEEFILDSLGKKGGLLDSEE